MRKLSIAILIVLLTALLLAGLWLAPVDAGDKATATPAPIHVQLEPGQRMYFICGDTYDDHYTLSPFTRLGAVVDCHNGDIGP